MKTIACVMIVLAVFATGCAHLDGQSAPSEREQARAECMSEADKHYRARYTDDWNAYVEKCMEEKLN